MSKGDGSPPTPLLLDPAVADAGALTEQPRAHRLASKRRLDLLFLPSPLARQVKRRSTHRNRRSPTSNTLSVHCNLQPTLAMPSYEHLPHPPSSSLRSQPRGTRLGTDAICMCWLAGSARWGTHPQHSPSNERLYHARFLGAWRWQGERADYSDYSDYSSEQPGSSRLMAS